MSYKVEKFIFEFIGGAILGSLCGFALWYKLRGWTQKGLIIFTCAGALIGGFVIALSRSPIKIPRDK
jgi:hypothetical protein